MLLVWLVIVEVVRKTVDGANKLRGLVAGGKDCKGSVADGVGGGGAAANVPGMVPYRFPSWGEGHEHGKLGRWLLVDMA